MNALTRQMRRFRDQEDGLVMTEFLIMLPLLVWTFMALFVYWDAFTPSTRRRRRPIRSRT